jgi:hypothetical protein
VVAYQSLRFLPVLDIYMEFESHHSTLIKCLDMPVLVCSLKVGLALYMVKEMKDLNLMIYLLTIGMMPLKTGSFLLFPFIYICDEYAKNF